MVGVCRPSVFLTENCRHPIVNNTKLVLSPVRLSKVSTFELQLMTKIGTQLTALVDVRNRSGYQGLGQARLMHPL